MTADVHFVQGQDGPILVGSGDGTLCCPCGNALIASYRPTQFLGIGIRCGRCEMVTVSPPLAEGRMLPANLIIAELSLQPRFESMTVPPNAAVVGRAEMDRLGPLFRPVTPPDSTYQITGALLDEVTAAFQRLTGDSLPVVEADPSNPFTGVRDHALAWAVGHLRTRIRSGSWACMDDAATSNAVTHVTGFLHFVATWSRHPLFPVMVDSAADRGFSLHGLALFAAAHALAMMGNRIGFREPHGYPARIEAFDLAIGTSEVTSVRLAVFDRFEYPFGQPWDQASLHAAVSKVVAGVQGRINLRNPGLLLLSPGTALLGFDEALIEAVKLTMQVLGSRNRGLMAVAPIVLRMQPMADATTVRFGFGLFPVQNRHYRGGDVQVVDQAVV